MSLKEKHLLYDDCCVTINLYKTVSNAKELRQCVMAGDIVATLLKPSLIADPFQVIAAANRAIHLYKQNKMTTKNVHSEVIFCMSPTKNISDAFKKFGVGDNDTSVCVVLINDLDGSMCQQLTDVIKGTLIPVEEISSLSNEPEIKKIYKVTDTELTSCSLTSALVSRIAAKEFVTV